MAHAASGLELARELLKREPNSARRKHCLGRPGENLFPTAPVPRLRPTRRLRCRRVRSNHVADIQRDRAIGDEFESPVRHPQDVDVELDRAARESAGEQGTTALERYMPLRLVVPGLIRVVARGLSSPEVKPL
jgi:hypothetical protein